MCILAGAGALAANVALATTAVTTAASVGMGIYNAQAQASAAQASLSAQSQAQQASIAQANAAASQQVAMQRQQQQMQASQFRATQQMQLQQQQSTQQLQISQQYQQQLQAQELQSQSQNLQIEQLQSQQQLQQRMAAEARNLQMAQANAEITNRYKNQRAAVINERSQIMSADETKRRLYQQDRITAELQKDENLSAANRVYLAEQNKLNEKRKEAAFEAQAIMAKSIGAKGSILATGRTGQSVGLLVNDAERQAGFAIAQEEAMLDQAEVGAIIGMEQAFEQNRAADKKADSQVGFNPELPYLPKLPEVPDYVSLAIPT